MTFLGGPAHARGEPSQLVLLGWKTWKLQRSRDWLYRCGKSRQWLKPKISISRLAFTWAELNSELFVSIEPNLSALREQGSITYNSQCSERPPLLHIPSCGNLQTPIPERS